VIRPAEPADVAAIVAMVGELAEYERSRPAAIATAEQFAAALFGPVPSVYCHVAVGPGNREPVGFALWFRNFSTWVGRPGIYLEDLYVRPAQRGQGYGRALLATLAAECMARGYGRLEWWVLDWNAEARRFYDALGAQALTEWVPYRLDGPALAGLAGTQGHGR